MKSADQRVTWDKLHDTHIVTVRELRVARAAMVAAFAEAAAGRGPRPSMEMAHEYRRLTALADASQDAKDAFVHSLFRD